jgi:GntR family transcriptional regulator/MocR family aminotransferase
MERGKNAISIEFEFEQHGDDLLYRQIYQRFKEAILNGGYPYGSRVPSIRTLASQLQLSRNTVEKAYDLLIGEGYLLANGQAGTIVAYSALRNVSPHRDRPATLAHIDVPIINPAPFQVGMPALDAFPVGVWGALYRKLLSSCKEMCMVQDSARGFAPLREAVAAYLSVARAMPCTPAQVFITSGYRQSLQFLIGTLLNPGESVWLEDPHYPPAHLLLEQWRMRQVHVPVDDDGLNVAEGIRLAPHARMALVTPTNQSPLGVVLSIRRKMELLAWAARERSWLVEDDYDSEYCFDGRPPQTLTSLDENGRTIYQGTFSKTVHPALRLAYIVVPLHMVETFADAAPRMLDGCALHTQKVLASFMAEGHFARHLKKMRILHARRRTLLLQALRERLGDQLRISKHSRGLSLLAHLDESVDDVVVAERASEAGLSVGSLSSRYGSASNERGLFLGFANFTNESEVRRAVELLADCLPKASSTAPRRAKSSAGQMANAYRH